MSYELLSYGGICSKTLWLCVPPPSSASQASPDKLTADVVFLVIAHCGRIEKPGEEEETENEEHDEKLHEDDEPQGTPQRHAPEAVLVEVPDIYHCLPNTDKFIMITNINFFYILNKQKGRKVASVFLHQGQ